MWRATSPRTAEASTAYGIIPKEDELEIIENTVDIRTCDFLFQYSLVRVDRLAAASRLPGRLSRCCTTMYAAVG